MKTLVVTLDPAANGEHAVAAYFDDGSPAWRTVPAVRGVLAAGLTAAPYLTDGNGNELTPEAMVEFLQSQDRASPLFQTIGEYLWSLFTPSGIGPFLADTWAKYVRTNAHDVKPGLRTILDIRDERLRTLPWELMIRNNVPLFAAPLNPILRGRLEPNAAPDVVGLVLKVLVVVGSKPGDSAVRAEEEIEFLEDAARKFRREIDLRIERPTSIGEFTALYRDCLPHVLHFTGHGATVKRPGLPEEPALEFHDAAGSPWYWAKREIQGTLAVGAPRLAFLNACRTAVGARRLVGALSDEFLAAGTLSVVATQADIGGAEAAVFSGAAYEAMALGQPLDVALAKARYDVRQRTGMADRRDWCLPSLTVSVDVPAVLPPRLQLAQAVRDRLDTTPEFVDIQAFVDRRPQRMLVDPMTAQAPLDDLLVVWGPQSTGKTAMLSWFLEGCAWCGHAVKYVDLKSGRPGYLDVLERIRQRDPSVLSDLREPLAGDFTRFDEIARLIRGGPAVAGMPDDPVDSLFAAFRAGLVDSAKGAPLVIALDHVEAILADDFRKYLRPHLLDWVVRRRLRQGPVRFVLCCTENEYRDLKIDTLAPARTIDVHNFRAHEFDKLYRDYLLGRNVPRQKIPPPPWAQNEDFQPVMLCEIYDLMAKFKKI